MNKSPRPSILVVDDDDAFRLAMAKALGRLGFSVQQASSGEEAVEALRSGASDVALLDLQLGDIDGLEVLRRSQGTRTRVIVVTGHGTIPAAVEAMRLGASHFVQKPIDAPAIVPFVEDAVVPERPQASAEGDDLGMAGGSEAMQRLREWIRRAGPTDETVLVTGESGSGKELVAKALHAVSPRARKPFVAFNCAQAHRELFDAELFGHVRGAFTGATQDRPGLFREAHGGTLFLDEIGELPLGAQAKLLRALETHTIRPVGGTREIPVDTRVVAATNRNLAESVKKGEFREDLFFRLNVLDVEVPPLRERKDDLPAIALALLARISEERGKELSLDGDAVAVLEAYDWPGNVRELANVLKRAAIFCSGGRVTAADLREAIGASIYGHPEARSALSQPKPEPAAKEEPAEELTLAEIERRHILETFDRLSGNVTHTALALGIDRRTLQRKLRSYGREAGEE